MSHQRNEMMKFLQEARKAGWEIKMGTRHWRIYPKDKIKSPITMSASPSDSHAMENARKDFRNAGLDV